MAVHELAQHPTAGEMVAATHGRSLWVLDVTPLRQMTPEALKAGERTCTSRTRRSAGSASRSAARSTARQPALLRREPAAGRTLYYSLTKKADKVALKIVNLDGKTVRELQVPADAGLHHVTWDLAPLGAGDGQGGGRQGGGGGGGRGFRGFGVPNGVYRVVLAVDGQDISEPLTLQADPTRPTAIAAEEMESIDRDPDRDADRDREEEEHEHRHNDR